MLLSVMLGVMGVTGVVGLGVGYSWYNNFWQD